MLHNPSNCDDDELIDVKSFDCSELQLQTFDDVID